MNAPNSDRQTVHGLSLNSLFCAVLSLAVLESPFPAPYLFPCGIYLIVLSVKKSRQIALTVAPLAAWFWTSTAILIVYRTSTVFLAIAISFLVAVYFSKLNIVWGTPYDKE